MYDALGRRESKTISGTATNFLYDGLNLEQELNGTTPTVNYLTGANIDKTLSRTDSSGTESYLSDNLGSTLALTTSTGAIATSYSYEPYGNTTASGTSSTNALQYTGRENDGDALYYYRARYYDPVYSRFVSEDPIGLAGGINGYAYAGGNPIIDVDPLGLSFLLFDQNSGTISIYSSGGDLIASGPAANNVVSSASPFPAGYFSYSWHNTNHPADPNGSYGMYGDYIFNVPNHSGLAVHSGRLNKGGYTAPTKGCIRTTDEFMYEINLVISGGGDSGPDPLTDLIVVPRLPSLVNATTP